MLVLMLVFLLFDTKNKLFLNLYQQKLTIWRSRTLGAIAVIVVLVELDGRLLAIPIG